MTFVAHPDGTVEDTRVFIDPTADTGFGPQIDAQAWAAGDPSVEPQPYREHHSWAAVARRAALALGVGIAAAGVVVTLGGFRSSASQPPTDPPSAVPASQDISTTIEMPPPFTMPPDVPVARITDDGEYFQTLYRRGWEITDPPQALHAAQIVCSNLAIAASRPAWTPEAHSARSYVAWWMLHYDTSISPDWTLADTQFLVDTDAQFYCPEYR